MTGTWYGNGLLGIANGDIDLGSDTFKLAFTGASHTPNPDTHDFRDDLTDEITGTNLPAGGISCTVTLNLDTTGNRVRVRITDTNTATVTATGIKNVHLYKVVGSAATDRLVGYGVLDVAVSPSAGPLAIDFDDTEGFLRIGPYA
jgi:hypothetical protein